jgi:hypothetical protein
MDVGEPLALRVLDTLYLSWSQHNAYCSGTFGKPTQPENLRADDGVKSVGLRDIAHRKHDWSTYEERKL